MLFQKYITTSPFLEDSSSGSTSRLFVDVVVVDSKEDNEEGNDGKSHNTEPEEVLSFISGGIDPGNVPEVVASDRHDGSGEGGEETPVGEVEVAFTVELTEHTTAGVVQAVSSIIVRFFPSADL